MTGCRENPGLASKVFQGATSDRVENDEILGIASQSRSGRALEPSHLQASPAVKRTRLICCICWPSDKKLPKFFRLITIFHSEFFFGQNFSAAPLLSDSSPLVSDVSGAC